MIDSVVQDLSAHRLIMSFIEFEALLSILIVCFTVYLRFIDAGRLNFTGRLGLIQNWFEISRLPLNFEWRMELVVDAPHAIRLRSFKKT